MAPAFLNDEDMDPLEAQSPAQETWPKSPLYEVRRSLADEGTQSNLETVQVEASGSGPENSVASRCTSAKPTSIRQVVVLMGITVGPVAMGEESKAGSGEEDRECLWYRREEERSCEAGGGAAVMEIVTVLFFYENKSVSVSGTDFWQKSYPLRSLTHQKVDTEVSGVALRIKYAHCL
ncbi:hypothetical protein Cgig2_026750 [Carnegiea gigantea]|uniref:Uncharacterized protein n=1 Tax=Carnegiea gigantea TaxID=171969 RepID=A0A9Q1JU84_9CARY|nr:hypothetical protein Cgig2_026750 [Carnegiea gigantea]